MYHNLDLSLGRNTRGGYIPPLRYWISHFNTWSGAHFSLTPAFNAQSGSFGKLRVWKSSISLTDMYLMDTGTSFINVDSNNQITTSSDLEFTIDGFPVTDGDTFPLDKVVLVEFQLSGGATIGSFGADSVSGGEWAGRIWDIFLSNPTSGEERLYPCVIEYAGAPPANTPYPDLYTPTNTIIPVGFEEKNAYRVTTLDISMGYKAFEFQQFDSNFAVSSVAPRTNYAPNVGFTGATEGELHESTPPTGWRYDWAANGVHGEPVITDTPDYFMMRLESINGSSSRGQLALEDIVDLIPDSVVGGHIDLTVWCLLEKPIVGSNIVALPIADRGGITRIDSRNPISSMINVWQRIGVRILLTEDNPDLRIRFGIGAGGSADAQMLIKDPVLFYYAPDEELPKFPHF